MNSGQKFGTEVLLFYMIKFFLILKFDNIGSSLVMHSFI